MLSKRGCANPELGSAAKPTSVFSSRLSLSLCVPETLSMILAMHISIISSCSMLVIAEASSRKCTICRLQLQMPTSRQLQLNQVSQLISNRSEACRLLRMIGDASCNVILEVSLGPRGYQALCGPLETQTHPAAFPVLQIYSCSQISYRSLSLTCFIGQGFQISLTCPRLFPEKRKPTDKMLTSPEIGAI